VLIRRDWRNSLAFGCIFAPHSSTCAACFSVLNRTSIGIRCRDKGWSLLRNPNPTNSVIDLKDAVKWLYGHLITTYTGKPLAAQVRSLAGACSLASRFSASGLDTRAQSDFKVNLSFGADELPGEYDLMSTVM
jgi:hypothetical protein